MKSGDEFYYKGSTVEVAELNAGQTSFNGQTYVYNHDTRLKHWVLTNDLQPLPAPFVPPMMQPGDELMYLDQDVKVISTTGNKAWVYCFATTEDIVVPTSELKPRLTKEQKLEAEIMRLQDEIDDMKSETAKQREELAERCFKDGHLLGYDQRCSGQDHSTNRDWLQFKATEL